MPVSVEDAGLGGHDELPGGRSFASTDHAARGEDVDFVLQSVLLVGKCHAVRGAAALRMDKDLFGIRMKVEGFLKVPGTDPGVDVALSGPDADVLSTGHPGDVVPQVQIGEEEDLPIGGDG
ncbi:MAG: hypothetical protein V3U33_01595, partial [candidate division NC10 bacterium]